MKTILYQTLKLFAQFGHWLYYRKVVVRGSGNLPKDEALIFSPNHRNGLMDALAVIFASGQHPVFLSRADIFSNPWANRFLRFMRIIPVYRIRDGRDRMDGNRETFDLAVRELLERRSLALFPEGTHAGPNQRLPLRKGLARVAFQAAEASGFRAGLSVIPMGIHYSNPGLPGGSLLVNFGEALPLSAYIESYRADPIKAQLELTRVLRDRMESLFFFIDDSPISKDLEASLGLLEGLEQGDRINDGDPWQSFNTLKRIQDWAIQAFARDPEALQLFLSASRELAEHCTTRGLDPRFFGASFSKKSGVPGTASFLVLGLQGVLAIPGLVFHWLPVLFPGRIVRSHIRDHQFHSTFHFTALVLLLPLYYGVVGGLVSLWFGWVSAFLTVGLGLVSGIIYRIIGPSIRNRYKSMLWHLAGRKPEGRALLSRLHKHRETWLLLTKAEPIL